MISSTETTITLEPIDAPFLKGTLFPGAFLIKEGDTQRVVGLVATADPETGELKVNRVDRSISGAQLAFLLMTPEAKNCASRQHSPRPRPAARKRCNKGVDHD